VKTPDPLAPALRPYEAAIRQSLRPTGLLSPHPEDKSADDPRHSRLGGMPYWPALATCPLTADDRPLPFLIQLNFAEWRHVPPFPAEGLLQLFARPHEGVVGRYYNAEELGETELLDRADYDLMMRYGHPRAGPVTSPVGAPTRLALTWVDAPPPPNDWHFSRFLPGDLLTTHATRGPYDRLCEPATDSHLGGYGHFPQGDPRVETTDPGGWTLLLELPSDPRLGLMWGDGQELCVFIRTDALLRLDFSNLWLCINP
jgi:uncharacterized protein YwqG